MSTQIKKMFQPIIEILENNIDKKVEDVFDLIVEIAESKKKDHTVRFNLSRHFVISNKYIK